MVKAKDLVGKTYTDAYSSLGLESYLDSKTGHHLIRDVPEAETVLGIYEAFQPEYNTPTLTHKYSRLKTLAECISDKFNNFRHSKTAAVLAAGSIVTAGAISAIAKDLMPHHPGIIMDAKAQSPDTLPSAEKIIELDDLESLLDADISGNYVYWSTKTYKGGDGVYEEHVKNIKTNNVVKIPLYSDAVRTLDKDAYGTFILYYDPVLAGIVAYDFETNETKIISDSININTNAAKINDLIITGHVVNNWDKCTLLTYNTKTEKETTTDISDVHCRGGIQADEDKLAYILDTENDVSIKIVKINPDSSHKELKKISISDTTSPRINTFDGNYVLYDDTHIIDINTGDELYFNAPSNGRLLDFSDGRVIFTNMDDNYDGADSIWMANLNSVISTNEIITYVPSETEITPELESLVKQKSPTYLFSEGEKYTIANPYADDSDITNNLLNWDKNEFPNDLVVYYAVTDYRPYKVSAEHPEGFKVIQYWSYYVYNDWGSDKHKHDWEVIHKWVDNKNGEVFYTSASMHLWDNEYEKNVNSFFVEEGGHGMSKDNYMIDYIKMSFNGVAKVLDKNSYELRPLNDLQEYAANDFPGERGKFPTDQERFKDPDKAIRLSNSLETIVSEFKIKNSPELLVIADGKATGFRDGRVIEDIPMSNYIENEERIIIIGDHKDIEVVLTGTENEKYELEGRTYNNGVEKTFTNKGTIRDNEIKKLDVTDTETPSADNESPNYTQLMVAAAIGGGALPILYLVRNKKSEKVDSSNKPKPEVINSNLKTTQISDLMNKHKKSKDAKTKRTNLPEECLEEEGQRKAISFADFSDE